MPDVNRCPYKATVSVPPSRSSACSPEGERHREPAVDVQDADAVPAHLAVGRSHNALTGTRSPSRTHRGRRSRPRSPTARCSRPRSSRLRCSRSGRSTSRRPPPPRPDEMLKSDVNLVLVILKRRTARQRRVADDDARQLKRYPASAAVRRTAAWTLPGVGRAGRRQRARGPRAR